MQESILGILTLGVASPESMAALADIAKGLGAGAIAAAIGYMKSQGEKFDFAKFGKTVVFGGIVGIIAAWKGTNMDEAEKWAAMVGVSLAFSFVWDAFARKVAAPGLKRMMGGENK